MMRKNKIKKVLPLYLTGDLSGRGSMEIEEEMKKSPQLEQEAKIYSHLIEQIESISAEKPDREKTNRMIAFLKQEQLKDERPAKSLIPFLSIAAVSIAVLVIIGIILRSPGKVAETEQWLINNLYKYEDLNGYISISEDDLQSEELTRLNDELTEELLQLAGFEESDEVMQNFKVHPFGFLPTDEAVLGEIINTENGNNNGGSINEK